MEKNIRESTMSDYDEVEDLFPNADKRKARVEKLKKRLDAFFEDFIESPAEGGWPIVDDATMTDIYDIFGEIIDLKMERDEDGDRAVRTYCERRKLGRLVTVMIPHSPRGENVTEVEVLEHLNALSRALSSLQSYGETVARELEYTTRHLADEATKRARFRSEIEAFEGEIESGVVFDDFSQRWLLWLKDNENIDPDAVAAVREKLARAEPETLEGMITSFLSATQKMTNDEQGLFDVRALPVKLFGKQFSADPRVKERTDGLYAAGRAKREADREARRAAREANNGA